MCAYIYIHIYMSLCVHIYVYVYLNEMFYIHIFLSRHTTKYFQQERNNQKTSLILHLESSEEFWIQHERWDFCRGGMQHMWKKLSPRPLILLNKKVRDKSSIKKFSQGHFD